MNTYIIKRNGITIDMCLSMDEAKKTVWARFDTTDVGTVSLVDTFFNTEIETYDVAGRTVLVPYDPVYA